MSFASAILLDAENLFHHQAKHTSGQLPGMFQALMWWCQQHVLLDRSCYRRAYTKKWDVVHEPIRETAHQYGFHFPFVNNDEHRAELMLIDDMTTLREEACSTYVLGGADGKMLTAARDAAREQEHLTQWVVLPTSYPRENAAFFRIGAKWEVIGEDHIEWLQMIHRDWLDAQHRDQAVPDQGDGPAASTLFGATGGAWRDLHPSQVRHTDPEFVPRATRIFVKAGWDDEDASSLATTLASTIPEVSSPETLHSTTLQQRSLARIILAALFTAFLRSPEVSPLGQLFGSALLHGNKVVRDALQRASALAAESAAPWPSR